MLKNHPKGLLVAFFSNMGERFGFYTMMAILVLFLQAKYGLSAEEAGGYYSWFYFAIYALALIGGLIADATNRYKTVILLGIIIMFGGYAMIAMPGMSLTMTLLGLFIIAFGNGLFKGNLQAVVGQMYDNPEYSKVRDTGFMIFYMGINVGAFFAPFVATGIRNWFLRSQGFEHDASLPSLCHAFLNGKVTDPESLAKFESLASKVSGATITGTEQLTDFAHKYIDAFSRGYNWAFGVAAVAMVISLLVYVIFNKKLPNKEKKVSTTPAAGSLFTKKNLLNVIVPIALVLLTGAIFWLLGAEIALGLAIGLFFGFVAMMFMMSTKEELPKVTSLLLVFVVVIFFWMSFHQNGLTLTLFARDYTVKEVGPFTNIFFNIWSMLSFIGTIAGLVLMFARKQIRERMIGLVMFLGLGYLTYYQAIKFGASNPIAPEVFQSFNPLFIVVLTFPVMGAFAWMNKRNIEPSTPKKIGIGMIIAAIGFVVVLLSSIHLIAPKTIEAQGLTEWGRVSPYWLISSYLILTIAELFLSPMGLSFVSKVAPQRFQGLMQGGWLLATAIGNKLLFVGSFFWERIELWQLWTIFIVCCLLSAIFIFSIMRRLEEATK
ncbi:MAG: MFS transporter [Tenuifilum sp.]|uniref:peptide MFS transporter n=2 Tax=Tenuifilum sp. TaxID=2760880 RepID=UPI001B51BF65|nr:MFS transporter [Bacteroidales bacterium]HOK60675.1 MFS transporter [Tenuifilum sp.]MBP9029105.1 MFS transporter [Bacteroidales bacterium]HOK84908.1 MFS transporter [Tenuifilum sp.]HON69826.1 MFS transporter [Tenuifilum sp.]